MVRSYVACATLAPELRHGVGGNLAWLPPRSALVGYCQTEDEGSPNLARLHVRPISSARPALQAHGQAERCPSSIRGWAARRPNYKRFDSATDIDLTDLPDAFVLKPTSLSNHRGVMCFTARREATVFGMRCGACIERPRTSSEFKPDGKRLSRNAPRGACNS